MKATKIDECLAQFKNADELYRKSATFHWIVQALARGASPYDIIQRLCEMTDDQTKALIEYVNRDTRPTIMDKYYGKE